MRDVKTIILEDGIEYYVVDELELDNITYYYLANMEDDTDICVRKKTFENNEEFMSMLDNEQELSKVLAAFSKKYDN